MADTAIPAPVAERVRVLSNRKNWTGTRTVTLHSELIAGRIQPGQFIMLRLGDASDPYLPRGFLVPAWDADSQSLEILFHPSDPRHARMEDLAAGTGLHAFGPVGRRLPLADFGHHAAVVSSSPLGERFTDLLEEVCPNSRFSMTLLDISDPPQELKVPGDAATVLLIGDKRLFAWAEPHLRGGGARVIALHDALIGCGVGACLACPARCRDGTRRICVEGPWFDMQSLEFPPCST